MATTPVVPTTQQQVAATVAALPEGSQAPVVAPVPIVPADDGRPRNADGTFAPVETLKSETPEYKVFDIGGGKFRYEYATGEKFSGTLEEIASSNAAAHVKTKQWAQIQRQPIVAPVVAKTPEQIANEQAQTYILDTVAQGMGLTNGEELKTRLNNVTESSEQFSGRMLAAEFQASTPDFNATPDNSSKLTKILDDAKLPYNLTTLQMAHAHALKHNIYQAAPVQQQQVVTLIPPMVQSTAPPSAGGDPMKANVTTSYEELQRMMDVARAAQAR